MPLVIDMDYETRSAADLKKTGTYRYMIDPTTDVWCARFRDDTAPEDFMDTWVPGMPVPELIQRAADEDDAIIYAHKADFERLCTNKLMTRKYGWPEIATQKWRCTMVMAYANGLPGSLENAAPAAGISRAKDMSGHANMMRMAKPKTRVKCALCAGGDPTCTLCDGIGEIYTWWDDPVRVATQIDYCATDVWVQRDLRKKLRPLQPVEQKLWELDQAINDRGIKMDVDLATAAQKIVEACKLAMTAYANEKWGITSLNSIPKMCAALAACGVHTTTLKKAVLEDLLDDAEISEEAREILELRKQYAQASVAKIVALFDARCPDDRIRGLLQFWAAFTGRWAGRGFQPQNLKRPLLEDVPTAIECVAVGSYEFMAMMYDDVLSAIGDCIRGMVVPHDDCELIAGDYPNIEGRVLSWLSGEQWKLDLFGQLDDAHDDNDDMYIRSFCATFGVPKFNKKHPWRQIGKIMELASGYQGGHGAYVSFGAKGKKLRQISDAARANATDEEWEEARQKFKQRGVKRYGMSEYDWVGLKIVIQKWRAKHEATTKFWRDVEAAAIEAVENPGVWYEAGKIAWKKAGNTLYMKLPVTGRLLPYQRPKVIERDAAWVKKEPEWIDVPQDELQEYLGEDEMRAIYQDRLVRMHPNGQTALVFMWARKKTLTHFSVISSSNRGKRTFLPSEKSIETSRWGRIATYGGMLAENATQAVARDILAYAMKRLDDAGYPIVLTVHDEAVAEVPDDFGSVEEFMSLMADIDPGYDGLVIGTPDVWRGKRYRK